MMSNTSQDDSLSLIQREDLSESTQNGQSSPVQLRSSVRLAKQEQSNSNHSGESNKDSNDAEMLSMFSSVWVKVEVEDNELDQIGSNEDSLNLPNDRVSRRKKRSSKRNSSPKRHNCTLCDYTTKYKNCLISHIYGHQNKKPFRCEFCEYASKYATALYRHVMVRHNEEKSKQLQSNLKVKPVKLYNCEDCEYKTPYKWNLSSHKRAHRIKDDKRFRCEICGYATAFKHNIDKHRKVHGDNIYTCEKCPFTTKYEGHITRHLVKIHNEDIAEAKLFNCDHCKFGTKYNWRLNIHKSRMQRDVPIKCSNCSFQTFFKCESKLHKNEHFPLSEQITYTDTEITNFINENLMKTEEYSTVADFKGGNSDNIINFNEISPSLTNNTDNTKADEATKINDSTNLTNTIDPELNVTYDNTTSLEEAGISPIIDSHGQANNYVIDPRGLDWNSIDVVETSDREKPFACTACKYSAKFKASVQRHFQRLHTDNEHKPYRCTNCDFSTKTKDQIALHNKRSQNDDSLICKTCNFTTFYKCAYALHQKTHYEHKCSMCNHITKHKHDLQRHIALEHMGAGAKCRFCNFKTARREAMLTHEAAHTGFKPFQCKMCDYASVRRSLLHNHFRRKHQQKSLTENISTNLDSSMNEEQLCTKK